MEWWYDWLKVLPFEWAVPGEMNFMKNALLAIIILTPLFGILGTMIVNNRMAFFSDAIGHGAFTGIVIGSIVGLMEPTWSSALFALIFSGLISMVKIKSRLAGDTVIGVFSSTSVALGIFLATSGGRNFAKLNRYLIGDLLNISPEEIFRIFIVFLVIVLFWIFILNKLVIISVHSSLAQSRGVKVLWVEIVFSCFIAVVVTLSLSWVGLLVINAFLVLPATISRLISNHIRMYTFLSVVISMGAGIAGLIASYYFDSVPGATIVLFLSALFLVTFLLRKKFTR